jgi:hypothetical protein
MSVLFDRGKDVLLLLQSIAGTQMQDDAVLMSETWVHEKQTDLGLAE